MTDRNNAPSSSTPPMVPATLEDDSFAQLRLLRSRRVGVVTYYRMLREYGTARAALEALPEVARAAGVKDYRICPENIVQAELRAAKGAGARLVTHDSVAYPPHLAELDDAPPFYGPSEISTCCTAPWCRLWARGMPPPSGRA